MLGSNPGLTGLDGVQAISDTNLDLAAGRIATPPLITPCTSSLIEPRDTTKLHSVQPTEISICQSDIAIEDVTPNFLSNPIP